MSRDQAKSVPAFSFGGAMEPVAEATAFVPAEVGQAPDSPAPVAAPQPEPPVAEQPIVEVPGELLEEICGVFYHEVVQHAEAAVRESATAELEVLQSRYATAVQTLVGVSNELAGHNKAQILELACQIAVQLAGGQLRTDPALMFGLVTEALASVQPGEVHIHCSDLDANYLLSRQDELAHGAWRAFQVRVTPDAQLEPGDFRIESRSGAVDGRLEVRLKNVREALGLDG